MPYANNDGVRIYYEREGSGPPLVLQHGFTRSLDGWRDNGYVAALKDDYELILVDARGHGRSDKPHDAAAYRPETRAGDIRAVLDDAGVDQAIFWGYSMGGAIGYALMQYAPERFTAMVIGGNHPFARDPAHPGWRAESLRAGGMEGYIAESERQSGPTSEAARASLRANDPDALLAASLASSQSPGFLDALQRLTIPVLIYAGDNDQPVHDEAARAASGLAHVTFVSLPGLNHGEVSRQSADVLPLVVPFLHRVSAAAQPAAR